MELPTIMASLELDEASGSNPTDADGDQVWEDCLPKTNEPEDPFEPDDLLMSDSRRSRRIMMKSHGVSGGKHRCSIPPTKFGQPETEKDIKKYYLNKKYKLKRTCLETIYEEPKQMKNRDPATMGGAKQKRAITFDSGVTKAKIKRRKVQIKKMLAGRRTPGKCKFTVQDVKLRLAESELYHLGSNSP